MTIETYKELIKQGIYTKQSKLLISLNDDYVHYIYLTSFKDICLEKRRLLNNFGIKF